MKVRAVFDTNVVVSALRFQAGQLAWLRGHWAAEAAHILASPATIAELIDVLAYAKFRLSAEEIQALLADYLPHVDVIKGARQGGPRCRDPGDQKFVDLALVAKADVLVTGDRDLLSMRADLPFSVETPADYRKRFST